MFPVPGLTQLLIGGIAGAVAIGAIFLAGNHYGPNASWRAHREAEDAAKNAVLTDMIEHETEIGKVEDMRLAAANEEFNKLVPGLPQCILTKETVQALNLIGE